MSKIFRGCTQKNFLKGDLNLGGGDLREGLRPPMIPCFSQVFCDSELNYPAVEKEA